MPFYNPWQPVPSASGGYATGTVTNTAKALVGTGGITNAAIPTDATGARIQIRPTGTFADDNVVCAMRMDGGTPTPLSGFILGAWNWYQINTIEELNLCKVISAEGTQTVTVMVQFYYNTMNT